MTQRKKPSGLAPNILWIQTDEQRPDSLGCYGSTWAKTPNVDALARRGIVLQNCVCNSPVCVPSRASQLTARYPQEINVLHNQVADEHHGDAPRHRTGQNAIYPPGTVTFPEVFAAAGYATASFGKWHTPQHPTWQTNQSLVNLDQYSGYYALNAAYDEDTYHVIKRPGGTPIILAGTYPVAEGHPSQVITDWAIDWLRTHPKNQPFLLRVSHNWPHTPVLAPPPFDTLYDPDEIPIRFYDERAYQTRASYDRSRADLWRMRELSRDQVRQMWKDYMGLVACVDHEVGRMVAALREFGVFENTVILFSADHGKSLGEWGATEKGFFDSEVWRVPFVLAGPGVPHEPEPRMAICELVDTGKTLLNLAGLAVPAQFRGRDLLNSFAPDAVYGQIGWPDPEARLLKRDTLKHKPPPNHSVMRVAVRTQRYRMDVTWWRDGRRVPFEAADGNLFDLDDDPYETRNLWSSPSSQTTIRKLWDALELWSRSLHAPAALFA